MILYPGGTYDPTTNASTRKAMTQWDFVCEHTMVASFAGVDANWHAPGYKSSFSHFMVRGDGFVKQTQDLALRAAANLDGNYNVISIENADSGETFPWWDHNGSDVPAFSDAQVEANVALCRWLCDRFDIPPFLVPNTKPGTRGIAYHRQGISGNYVPYDGIVSGGVRWSTATGKACPGNRRVAQLKTEIIPALQEEEIDMAALADLEARVFALEQKVLFLEAANIAQHNKLGALEYGGPGNPGESPIVGLRPLTGQVATLQTSSVPADRIRAVIADAIYNG